ncbi:YafY family protein [Nocardioides sp.]|uniref:helix-turn-helix transcriptional regulator n=1 Tax=Nocardioides sp. TaxID=35761 RepID=UPI002ED13070
MLTTSARLLRLLARLQVPGAHGGPSLAAELGVSVRTLRNDVATLRELGYPVEATPGVAGGYRLGAGSRLPPLLLDDDEAMAVTLGLVLAASHGLSDTATSSMRAFTKVVALLPSRLRPRLESLAGATLNAPLGGPTVAMDTLPPIAAAIHAREQLRFRYRDASGKNTDREVEPYRLVHRGARWYLLGWDLARDDWRTFRVDRMRVKVPNGRRFQPRPDPEGGFEHFVVRALETAPWQSRYRVRLLASADLIRERAPASVEIEPDGEHACLVTVGSDDAAMVAKYLAWWDAPFEVLDSPELLAEVRLLAQRYADASRGA